MTTEKPGLLLKWGTLKGWSHLTALCIAVCDEYADLILSMSAATQVMTPRHKEWLCKLIDVVAEEGGTIQNDWSGEEMTAEAAKKYVTEYSA